MKNVLLTILAALAVHTASYAQDPFYVSGNKIMDPCREQFVPRGINYPVLDDWDFPANMNNGNEQSAEIMKANPNIVRITWYADYGQPTRPAYTLADLDSIISRFSRQGIVSVVTLMDGTCKPDYVIFSNRIAPWWVQPQVVALLQKHQGMVIANIANELGWVNWAGNQNAAFQTYKDTYKDMIKAMRDAGIKVPIMIDAPDCGTSIDRIIAAGSEFLNHDQLKNIIGSAHAYWGLDDSATVAGKVQTIANSTIPIILGEIANYQTDNIPCQYNIKYESILKASQQDNVGWMAWCWYKDHCPDRQMTTNGKLSSLSPYGQVIVNNPDWGLATKAMKTNYLKNGAKCDPSSVGSVNKQQQSAINWAQPDSKLSFNTKGSVAVVGMAGNVVMHNDVVVGQSYYLLSNIPVGIYAVRFTDANGNPEIKKIYVGQ